METTTNIFEIATKGKFRFTFKGVISTEDLWDLSVKELDSIFKGLNTKLKEVNEESLLQTKTIADKELEVKVEIIRYIVKVKLEEQEAKTKAKEMKEQREKIKEVLAKKQDQSLENKTQEELIAMLEEMGN